MTDRRRFAALTPYLPFIKWVLLCLALVFVARRAMQLWQAAPVEAVAVHSLWLIPAGLAYFAGWLPSVWLWSKLMRAVGQPIRWRTALRAYFVGHLGKYIPGKALALVIRGAMVEVDRASPLLAGVTGAMETLIYMSAGAALAGGLAPLVLTSPPLPDDAFIPWAQSHQTLWLSGILVSLLATTPFSARVLTQICRKTWQKIATVGGTEPKISTRLVAAGVFVTPFGWICHGISLGCVLQSLSDETLPLSQLPMWIATCSLSLVGGFVVLVAPGGIGVREGLLIESLKDQPGVGPVKAIVAAGILRSVWLVTELIAAGIFFALPGSEGNMPKSSGSTSA